MRGRYGARKRLIDFIARDNPKVRDVKVKRSWMTASSASWTKVDSSRGWD
jgi:hypothetical protein